MNNNKYNEDSVLNIDNVGKLKASGYIPRTIKAEIANNLTFKLRNNEPIFKGFFGYDDSVIPKIQNALLAQHDFVLLGQRGQGKTKLIRSLTELLDPFTPIIRGSELNDDPLNPISAFGKKQVASFGDDTEIEWVKAEMRFTEKLATPDISVADLIGEIDPIKVAEGRYLSNEEVLHFGLIPRSNRNIFAINELPDLAERIQVGLFNILEERDFQIRSFKFLIPIDLLFVATANPEDYTSRGRIITPLKDRFRAQIRTHYPFDLKTEIQIMDQFAVITTPDGIEFRQLGFIKNIIAEFTQLLRKSPSVNQHSGVSVRLTLSNLETAASNAIRRAIINNETKTSVRISDLNCLIDSTLGKVELETFDNDETEIIIKTLHNAILHVFKDSIPPELVGPIVALFDNGLVMDCADDLDNSHYIKILNDYPEIKKAVVHVIKSMNPGTTFSPDTTDELNEFSSEAASCMEFILEGLHLIKRLNKNFFGTNFVYTTRHADLKFNR